MTVAIQMPRAGARDPRLPRQPHPRGRGRPPRAASAGAPPSPPAPRPARARRSSCATETRAATAERACARRRPRERRDCERDRKAAARRPRRAGRARREAASRSTAPRPSRGSARTRCSASRSPPPTRPRPPRGQPLYRWLGGADGAPAAGPDDERDERRRARRQQRRPPGVHALPARRADLRARRCAGAPRSSTSCASVLQEKGYATGGRRRGRLRAEPGQQPRGDRAGARARSSRPATGRASRSRSRSTPPRASSTRTAATSSRARARALSLGRDGRVLGGLVRALPDRLDRGRARRAGLGRLGARSPSGSASAVQLVGDDLFVTNPAILRRASRRALRTRSW